MTVIGAAIILMWSAALALLAWYVATAAREVTYVTLADGRRQARSLPVVFKLLLPFAGNFDRLVSRPAFKEQVRVADEMLIGAGFEGIMNGKEFAALKILSPIAMGAVWCVFIGALSVALPTSPIAAAKLPLCLFGVALFYLQPILWLRQTLKKRHLEIMKALPFVLDILTLSVEAGMDFISALQRNCASRKMDALNEELLRMTKEIQVGASRKQALKNMADRVRQPDLKAVAYALIQADELGVSIGSILRIQADQLRSRRFDRAEKLASEAPTKMMGPLMLCIFPAVFIILLGPVLSQAMKELF